MLAVYLTIWIALALFTVGEVVRARRPRGLGVPWYASALGLTMSIVHTLLAFEVVHGWSHDDAVLNTAMQTERVFSAAVGWGVYVNYLFFAVWLVDLAWWRRDGGIEPRSRAVVIGLQAFYLVIILNAAVVFAVGARRALGAVLVLILALAWARQVRRMTH
jgi:hypothetical protein